MRILATTALLLGLSSSAFASNIVIMEADEYFDRDEMTVDAGETVVFDNRDEITHDLNIVDEKGHGTDKGLQKPGQKINVTFPHRGEYKVFCAISPKMKMTVIAR